MPGDVYTQLRKEIDRLGSGFNATESGVELDILKKIFTEEDAKLYVQGKFTACLEPIAVIAQRFGQTPEELLPALERLAANGVLLSSPPKEIAATPTHFAAGPWIGGIVEFQSSIPGRMDRDLAELCVKYFLGGYQMRELPLRAIPAAKTIVLDRDIEDTRQVATYDNVKEIIKKQDRILVAPCACCDLAEHLGQVIDQPRGICFHFGAFAGFYKDREIGRWVTQEEALRILEQCEEDGLIHQVTNLHAPECICNCGKFCGALMIMKRHPHPAQLAGANYYAEVDPSLCIGCEACLPRCHMEAIGFGEEESVAGLDRNRCIGCGVCVSSCPTGALSLQQKPEDERHVPPVSNPAWRSTPEYNADLGK